MPELAEVEYYRRQWDTGLRQRVARVALHARTRVFRGVNTGDIAAALCGQLFSGSWARGKQMLFRFGSKAWVGIHLGMTGKLCSEAPPFRPDKHDHLATFLGTVVLVFQDARQFGRVRVDVGSEPPEWWSKIPASPHEKAFTKRVMVAFLARHPRLPIKATLCSKPVSPESGIGWPMKFSGRLDSYPSARPVICKRTNWIACGARLVRFAGKPWEPSPTISAIRPAAGFFTSGGAETVCARNIGPL